MARDPICGMEVDPATARFQSQHEGTTYYFCSQGCRDEFAKRNSGTEQSSRKAKKERMRGTHHVSGQG